MLDEDERRRAFESLGVAFGPSAGFGYAPDRQSRVTPDYFTRGQMFGPRDRPGYFRSGSQIQQPDGDYAQQMQYMRQMQMQMQQQQQQPPPQNDFQYDPAREYRATPQYFSQGGYGQGYGSPWVRYGSFRER
jgi:hypothetical protein